MAIAINTNVNALLAQNSLVKNQAGLSQAMQRLSSGLRLNEASDDPAGLSIAVSMTQTANALSQGSRNANDGISLVQTAQSSMNDITNLLNTMSTLASQAASGIYSSSQLSNINAEFTTLLDEVNRVASTTQFNGITLLDGSSASVSIQVGSGATANDRLSITLSTLTTGSSGLNISSLSLTNSSNAQSAISGLTDALNLVTNALANVGASQVNLNAAISNDDALATSLQAARSRIQDADFALESSNLAKYNVLTQSNIAILAQANSTASSVLQLLR